MKTVNKNIVLVDDDESFLRVYKKILEAHGFQVHTATNGEAGLSLIRQGNYSLAIIDMVMEGMSGFDLLRKIKEKLFKLQVIVLTGEGSIPGAVEAIHQGAYTYLTKPVNIDELLLNVERAVQFYTIREENETLRNQLAAMGNKPQFIGESAAIKAIREKIALVAASNSSVLITGETGTGKEIVANLFHGQSQRAKGPLIKVNCAALAKSILESELFGHEKGAFTGAGSMKPGRFELAQNGTLFLDEISEIPLYTQTKILRAIQEKEVERLGGVRAIKTDFRLIAATNKDLKAEIEKGNFREDLFYRINVIPLRIPPLRERTEDIPVLLDYYLQYFCREMRKVIEGFAPEALEMLQNYNWPGNVRELRNLVERLVVLSQSTCITVADLPEEVRANGDEQLAATYQQAKSLFEKQYFRHALSEHGGNVSATAKTIGMARKNLQIKMKLYDLRDNFEKK